MENHAFFWTPVIDINRNYLKTIPIRPAMHRDQSKFYKLYNFIFTSLIS